MSIYDDGYGALWDISDGIKYLNVCQKSEFHRRVANGLLPPTEKTGGGTADNASAANFERSGPRTRGARKTPK
jgi:hypothetical protein